MATSNRQRSGSGNFGDPATSEGRADSGESRSHQSSIDTLRSLMQQIQSDREFHQRSLNELDQGLREVQSEIEEIVQMADAGQDEEQARGSNRGHGNRSKGGRSSRGESGPQKMMRMLEENNGEMPYEELKTKSGVKSPYSALYQLQNSGKIERDGDTVRLLKDDEEGGNSGGGRGGSKKGQIR